MVEHISLVILLLIGGSFTSGQDLQYLARDFFEDAGLECISAVESISQEEKELIIESRFSVSEEHNSAFSVISCEPRWLHLRDVDVHVYASTGGGWIVSVTSVLGNHDQTQHTIFYCIDEFRHITGEVDSETLGIGSVLYNELLDEADHFSEEMNSTVPLSIMDDGSLAAVPWTWMDPDWDNREIVNSITYVWNGTGFDKVVSRIRD